MKDRENLEWEELEVEHIITDEWIDFRKVKYKFPDGSVFSPFYNYSRRNYVVIVAMDTNGDYLCVRQFRHGIKKVTTEFPAGGIEKDENEDALDAAKRELQEETGYVSNEWSHLITVPSNATLADNFAYVYVAKNCKKVSGQHLDESEFLNVHLLSKEQVEEEITQGDFLQAIHIMAWYMVQVNCR